MHLDRSGSPIVSNPERRRSCRLLREPDIHLDVLERSFGVTEVNKDHDSLEKAVHANDIQRADLRREEGLDRPVATADEAQEPVDEVSGLDKRARGGVEVEVEAPEAGSDRSAEKGLARSVRGRAERTRRSRLDAKVSRLRRAESERTHAKALFRAAA